MAGRIRRRLADEAGVTMAEMAVVIGILSIALVAVFGAFASFNQQTVGADARTESLGEARQMMATLTRDLRTATKPPRDTGVVQPPPFTDARRNSVTFYANLETATSGALAGAPRRITLEVDATGVLWERIVEPAGAYPSYSYAGTPTSRRIGQFVVNTDTDAGALFRYLDDAGDRLTGASLSEANRAAIASVEVSLQVRKEVTPAMPATTLRTRVRLPNLAYQPTRSS